MDGRQDQGVSVANLGKAQRDGAGLRGFRQGEDHGHRAPRSAPGDWIGHEGRTGLRIVEFESADVGRLVAHAGLVQGIVGDAFRHIAVAVQIRRVRGQIIRRTKVDPGGAGDERRIQDIIHCAPAAVRAGRGRVQEPAGGSQQVVGSGWR